MTPVLIGLHQLQAHAQLGIDAGGNPGRHLRAVTKHCGLGTAAQQFGPLNNDPSGFHRCSTQGIAHFIQNEFLRSGNGLAWNILKAATHNIIG